MADLTFLETDADGIYETVITALEQSVKEPLYPGDERRIFGDALVAVFVAAFNQANDACKQKMLQYATGTVLDALGERYACYRLAATPARTTLRFSVLDAISSNIIIAQGTRVTPDNEVYFRTTEAAVLQAGTLSVDVQAECMTTGEDYNGYLIGTINQIVDIVPYIDAVSNIEITYDGDNGEPYPEDDGGTGDDHYRERIKLAPTALSVAGPRDAYEYRAKSADASITDVAIISDIETISKTITVYNGYAFVGGAGYNLNSLIVTGLSINTDYTAVYTDELLTITLLANNANLESIDIIIDRDMAGKVIIVPILDGGEIPDADMLQKVADACGADDVRPMTDKVIVQAPDQVEYDITITYYTTVADESDCINTIEGAGGAIEQFIDWQGTKMGRAINPDKLRSLCLAPETGTGCNRITVTAPTYKELTETQVASFKHLTVSHIVEG